LKFFRFGLFYVTDHLIASYAKKPTYTGNAGFLGVMSLITAMKMIDSKIATWIDDNMLGNQSAKIAFSISYLQQ